MTSHRRMTNKVVAVTGAGRGIGRGIAERFAGEGAAVVLADRDDGVREVAAEVASASGAETLGVTCDVTQESDVRAFIDAVETRFARLDVLINNAGTITIAPLGELTLDDWNR